MTDRRGIAVFDVCGTITKTNNTAGFIGFVLARESLPRYGLFAAIRMVSSLLSLLRIRSTCGQDRLRAGQIALLRGYSPARLKELAELYVDRLYTRGLLNHRILEAVQREQQEGRAIVLVSAAIDPPIAAIAGRLHTDGYWSSELETEDGCCTGRLKTDLLGRKTAVLDRIASQADLRNGSVYSDSADDATFMERFATRNVVLNTCRARAMWSPQDERYHFLVNYDEPSMGQDPDSVNERTARWTYVPFLYYAVSRFHREGVFTLLVRELAPAVATAYLLTNRDPLALILMPLSFWMFYSVYEIGGLVNDLLVARETSGKGLRRITPDVHIRAGLFVAIRAVLLGLILALLPIAAHAKWLYAAALGFSLLAYLVHTLIVGSRRVLTFILLKLGRSSVPLLILASRVDPATLACLGAIFFLVDAPARVYVYAHRQGLVKGTIPVSRLRLANATFLCGLGLAVHIVYGSPWLFAIASYHGALDGLWIFHGKVFRR